MGMILLKANDKLKTVFQKIIKTMGENVEWTDIFLINNNDLILVGTLRSLFFNFNTKRAYSNMIDITVNEEIVDEIADNELLENAFNMTLYTFGKWGQIKGLKVEKDYNQLNKLLEYIFNDIKIEASLTKDNLRFYKDGIQMTYEEVISMILETQKVKEEKIGNEQKEVSLEEEENEEHSLGLWHKVVWQSNHFSFQKEEITKDDQDKSRLGNQFYMVNYKCPICNDKLYMIVYPMGDEFRIETDEEGVYLARAYTCSSCNRFYTPKPQKLLAEGEVYDLDFEEDKVAYEDYQELLGKQGEKTSNSNFNQYETDYLRKEEEKEEQTDLEVFDDIESMSEDELEKQMNKMDADFYPKQIVSEYKEQVRQVLNSRKVKEEEKDEQRNKGSLFQADSGSEKLNKEKNINESQNETKFDENKKDSINKTEHKIEEDKNNKEKSKVESIHSELSFEFLKRIIDFIKKGDKQSFQNELESLSKKQLKELRVKINAANDLKEEKKNDSMKAIDQRLSSETEKEMFEKAVRCKDKSFKGIQEVMKEVKKAEINEEAKSSILSTLKNLLKKAGERELKQIVDQIPSNVTKKQYDQFKNQIEAYEGIDLKLSKKLLNEKRDEAEKKEIAGFIKKSNPRNRKEYSDTYQRLKEQTFTDRNVEPVLKKLHQKIYEMDYKAMERICGEPAALNFEKGIEAYEEILLGDYLPELKEDMLSQIDKRLTKLKTDECDQLVNKLMKEIRSYTSENPRIHFYQVRKILRGNLEEAENVIIQNALETYAKNREKYEYPILICDSSFAENGECGFVLTPNHIFYHSLFSHGKLDVMDIEEVFGQDSLMHKGIYVRIENSNTKISNSLQTKNIKAIAKGLNNFVAYLKEQPQSRKISYMAKEVHKVKCCYRCGFVYEDGNVCPKCGSKMND